MTRLTFLQEALTRLAAADLTVEETALMFTLSRFDQSMSSQLVRIMGAGFKASALANLGRRGLIIGKKGKNHRFRYGLTPSGVELMQSVLGKEVAA